MKKLLILISIFLIGCDEKIENKNTIHKKYPYVIPNTDCPSCYGYNVICLENVQYITIGHGFSVMVDTNSKVIKCDPNEMVR